MTEEEKLAEAYFLLGIKPGGSYKAVHSRWKRLAMVWHSDRFSAGETKDEAEEEMKGINNAHDILKKHFDSSHRESGPCVCQGGAPKSGGEEKRNPGPGWRRTTQENDRQEDEARRRTKERADRAAKEAADRAAEMSAAEAKAAAQAAELKQAQLRAQQTATLEDEKRRWQIAICMAAVWIVLNVFGWGLSSTKHWWTHLNEKWAQERQWKIDDENQKKAVAAEEAARRRQEADNAKRAQDARDAADRAMKERDLAAAQSWVNSTSQALEQCKSDLAKIQQQLDDPNTQFSERAKLEDLKAQGTYRLASAQTNYAQAQKKLAEVTESQTRPLLDGSQTKSTWQADPLRPHPIFLKDGSSTQSLSPLNTPLPQKFDAPQCKTSNDPTQTP